MHRMNCLAWIVLTAVKNGIDTFVGDAPQFDDITMLCLDYKKKMEVDAQ